MRKGNFYPKGVTATGKSFQFVFQINPPARDVRIAVCAGEKELMNITVPDDCRHGRMYSVLVEDIPREADSYLYYADGIVVPDLYARSVWGMRDYGQEKGAVRYRLPERGYDWAGDRAPGRPYSESVIYGVHVRGFTKHTSSGVKKKGTFAGIQEKIPYLKELGITAVELMPAWEFDEFERVPGQYQKDEREKINYWGFKQGYYYAPKSAYAYGSDAVREMKDMVRALHKAGIEVLMQFYFPDDFPAGEVPDILHFWAEEYHMDGFHLIGKRLPPSLLSFDPFLLDTKLIFEYFSEEEIYGEVGNVPGKNLGFWQEGFTRDMRRALKGDGGCARAMLHCLRNNVGNAGIINSMAGYNGFTLMDLVSYERKHNEENGEDNRDGAEQNYSWNCGAEGRSRKRTVQALRQKQIRNALSLLFLSQGTPYLQSGDEFGQTQEGNNNPYCQDSDVTWIDWRLLRSGRKLYAFTKHLIAFRLAHGVFRQEKPLKGMDYLSHGCPDISVHGREAWRPSLDGDSPCAGVMYCGKYVKDKNGREDSSFYIAYNMHWEPHEFALPKISRDMQWHLCLDTALSETVEEAEEEIRAGSVIVADGRSVRGYRAEKKRKKEEK